TARIARTARTSAPRGSNAAHESGRTGRLAGVGRIGSGGWSRATGAIDGADFDDVARCSPGDDAESVDDAPNTVAAFRPGRGGSGRGGFAGDENLRPRRGFEASRSR